MRKEKYTIDFSNVKYYMEIHPIIQKALDFPDYYGCNWSAFWDCLSEMCEILRRFKHVDNDLFSDSIKIEIVSGNARVPLR